MTPFLKQTLVVGASPKPERYSNAAVRLLQEYGHPVIALAKRAGFIDKVPAYIKLNSDGTYEEVKVIRY